MASAAPLSDPGVEASEPELAAVRRLARSLDGVMVFDGVCRFCSGYVRLVLRADRAGAIRFCAMQSPLGRRLCRAHGVDPDDPATFLFFDRGAALEATEAMAAMAARLPAPWRWLRTLTVLPKPWRDGVYRWTARNRYRLLGKRRTCLLPPPQVRARFLEDVPASWPA